MAGNSTNTSQWMQIIEPQKRQGWREQVSELWQYKDLIYVLFKRDFSVLYKQTALGPLWHIVQPLVTTVVFTLVFSGIAKISTDNTAPFMFYMAGILIWSFFSGLLAKTSTVLISNASLFGKIYFPRMIMPATYSVSQLYAFTLQFLIFLGFFVYFLNLGADLRIKFSLLVLPLILLVTAVLAIGVGLIIAALTVRYRDLAVLTGFGLRLWMFATPVIYPLSIVPESMRIWVNLNPMTSIMEFSRQIMLGAGTVNATALAVHTVLILLIFATGLILFNRAERTFIDSI